MLWKSEEAERVNAILAAGARAWTAAELTEVLALGAKRKPAGFDRHSQAIQQRYVGNQRSVVEGVLTRRYPNKAREMPVSPVNWCAFFAATDAGTYTREPERWLSVGGEKLPSDDERAKAFADLCAAAKLPSVMPEAERRAMVIHNVLVHVGWDDDAPCIRLYWPHDVVVITHPSKPGDYDAAYVVAVRQASPDAGSDVQWWWVWSREYVDAEDGTVSSWGAWQHVRVSTGGDQQGTDAIPVPYLGERLPFALLQTEQPEGSWLVDRDRDLIAIVDELNASRANEQYVMDLQGHTQGVYTGNQVEASRLVLGPDSLLPIGPGESITTIDFNPKLQDMREGRKLSLRELAVSRRNSPDAYAVEPGPPLSGVSRKIANAPHDRRVAEMSHVLVDFEEQQLLPILLDVVETFGQPGLFAGCEAHMTPRMPPDFEDPEARQRRAQEALDAGWISPARAAVEAGWYSSVEEAKKVGLVDEIKGKTQTGGLPAQTGGLAERLQQMRPQTVPSGTESTDTQQPEGLPPTS